MRGCPDRTVQKVFFQWMDNVARGGRQTHGSGGIREDGVFFLSKLFRSNIYKVVKVD
jgi:hypothetical protein